MFSSILLPHIQIWSDLQAFRVLALKKRCLENSDRFLHMTVYLCAAGKCVSKPRHIPPVAPKVSPSCSGWCATASTSLTAKKDALCAQKRSRQTAGILSSYLSTILSTSLALCIEINSVTHLLKLKWHLKDPALLRGVCCHPTTAAPAAL